MVLTWGVLAGIWDIPMQRNKTKETIRRSCRQRGSKRHSAEPGRALGEFGSDSCVLEKGDHA
jgi:hypothetical protein